jgi:hypothetical protein
MNLISTAFNALEEEPNAMFSTELPIWVARGFSFWTEPSRQSIGRGLG